MQEVPLLSTIIRQYVPLTSKNNSRGWLPVLCKVCDDHGKKGYRAGFKFDGETVGYNCFNCGHSAIYEPNSEFGMTKEMIQVMDAFNIPKVDWQKATFNPYRANTTVSVRKVHVIKEPVELSIPDYWYPLTDNVNNLWAQYAIEYLAVERGIDWKQYSFYLANKTDNPDSEHWIERLIIPSYKAGKMIFYQGRDLTGNKPKKYLSPRLDSSAVLHGFDEIAKNTSNPIFVAEGWFDAESINGVAVFGSKMTQSQIEWLNSSTRQKVVIPDRLGDGHLLAEQAIKLGWNIALPDIGDAKDVNEACLKYGKLFTMKSIHANTYSDFEAGVKLKMYCDIPTKKVANGRQKNS